MFKKDLISENAEYFKQTCPQVSRGRKKKNDSTHSSLASSISMKGKKPKLLAVKFAVPSNIIQDDEIIQYLSEQLSQVIRDIETLQNKKDMITNLLADALQKKDKGVAKLLGQDTEEEYVDETRYKFINRNTNSTEDQPQQSKMASILYELAISTNWSTDLSVLKLQNDDRERIKKKNINHEEDYDNGDSSFDSNSHDSIGLTSRSPSNVSQLLRNQDPVSKQFVQTNLPEQKQDQDEEDIFQNTEKRTNFQGGVISSEIGELPLITEVEQEQKNPADYERNLNAQNEESQQDLKLQQKEKCLWSHFDTKESIKGQLERIDELEEEQLKALAKNFGIKSKNIKQLKEMLQNIYAFLSRSKFPDEYLKEFRPSIVNKIDIL